MLDGWIWQCGYWKKMGVARGCEGDRYSGWVARDYGRSQQYDGCTRTSADLYLTTVQEFLCQNQGYDRGVTCPVWRGSPKEEETSVFDDPFNQQRKTQTINRQTIQRRPPAHRFSE